MDYVVGSVAALITGNVTPNRPRLMKRALTPTKHQASPNVTPKSEFVEDRSIFLSPTMQKKKAIVKKSPKRIFQNPDLDSTENGEGNSSLTSPMADKVKKHLKDELEGDSTINKSTTPVKSPKKKSNNKKESIPAQESSLNVSGPNSNETTPKKKKRKQTSESECTENVINTETVDNVSTEDVSPKKRKQRRKSVVDTDCNKENDVTDTVEPQNTSSKDKSPKKQKLSEPNIAEKSNVEAQINNSNNNKKKNKKRKKKSKAATETNKATEDNASEETNKENIQVDKNNDNQVNKENQGAKKKNKKRKKSKANENKPVIMETEPQDKEDNNDNDDDEEENTESSTTVNPNAITDKESDSEHESDDEIESENEEINKKVLEAEKAEASSEEDDEEEPKEGKKENKEVKKKEENVKENTEDEIKRTLFVGNVPFSAKCKKEIKKIFNKHGQIETIRIRTVPIKDGSYTPKLAVIKNELHPERTTVNVYIKYIDADSVEKALVENNTLLNENHLRVSRSSSTGSEHDPRCSVFIGNLPFAMEDEALRAKFEKCGEIHSVRIIRDKKTNAGKGFGYVNFESKDGVELALALTEEDLTVKNRILRVKRCTQTTNKKKPANNSNNQQKGGFRPGNQQDRGGFRQGQGSQRGGFRQGQGSQRGGFGQGQGSQRGGFGQGNQRGGGRPSQGNRQRSDFGQGNQVGQRGRFTPGNDKQQRFNKFDNQKNQGTQDEEGREGAFRRIMHKRKNQDGNGPTDGPPNKRANINQPNKEKKVRKEFVGMTAEKKKKNKFDKGQKKKKALSEILTK